MFGLMSSGDVPASAYSSFDQIASSGWVPMSSSNFEDTLDALIHGMQWDKKKFQQFRMMVLIRTLPDLKALQWLTYH